MATVEQKMGQSRGLGWQKGGTLEGTRRWRGGLTLPPTPSLVGGCKDSGICSDADGAMSALSRGGPGPVLGSKGIPLAQEARVEAGRPTRRQLQKSQREKAVLDQVGSRDGPSDLWTSSLVD